MLSSDIQKLANDYKSSGLSLYDWVHSQPNYKDIMCVIDQLEEFIGNDLDSNIYGSDDPYAHVHGIC